VRDGKVLVVGSHFSVEISLKKCFTARHLERRPALFTVNSPKTGGGALDKVKPFSENFGVKCAGSAKRDYERLILNPF